MFGYFISFLLGVFTCKYLKTLQQLIFPHFMNKIATSLPEEFLEFKKEALKGIKDVKSSFPEMKERNSVKILEVGVGTGANFEYYPPGCHLTVVDPNPNFKSFFNKNRAKYPQIESEDILVCGGEDMHAVADCSVDVVVMTWVLCSVGDSSKVIQQIRRVLTPGGKFFFFEHIREFDSKKYAKRSFLQSLLTKLRIWPTLFDGCELDRESLQIIQDGGFSRVDGKRVHSPGIASLITPHCYGVATK